MQSNLNLYRVNDEYYIVASSFDQAGEYIHDYLVANDLNRFIQTAPPTEDNPAEIKKVELIQKNIPISEIKPPE